MQIVENVKVLDVDSGKDTNRTVVTIVGDPMAVLESAFVGIKTASELINKYKTLDSLLKNAGEIPQKKRRETLLENKDKTFALSKEKIKPVLPNYKHLKTYWVSYLRSSTIGTAVGALMGCCLVLP